MSHHPAVEKNQPSSPGPLKGASLRTKCKNDNVTSDNCQIQDSIESSLENEAVVLPDYSKLLEEVEIAYKEARVRL